MIEVCVEVLLTISNIHEKKVLEVPNFMTFPNSL